jgi:phosphatidylglycerophosphatase C
MSVMSEVAAFDFDGTLSRRDCVGPFLVRIAGRIALLSAFASRPFLSARVASGQGGRDDLKAHVLHRTLGGRDAAFVRAEGERYAAEVVPRALRADVVARLRWHQDRGHRVVIVSASLDPYLVAVGTRLGVDAVLCTTMEEHEGVLTGRIVGTNCRAAEKVRRLHAWCGGAPAELWAYGDSAGDRELLAAAHHPTRVGRERVPALSHGEA